MNRKSSIVDTPEICKSEKVEVCEATKTRLKRRKRRKRALEVVASTTTAMPKG